MDKAISDIIVESVHDLLSQAGFPRAHVSWVDYEGQRQSFGRVSIESEEDLAILIGKEGTTLAALEHLIHLVSFRRCVQYGIPHGDFIVDINDYRKQQTEHLMTLARAVALRVADTRRAESLFPMRPHERKLIHAELASLGTVETHSIGEEPHRRIVIKPATNQESMS